MTATLPCEYFPVLRKEIYMTFIQSGKQLVKSGLFWEPLDSFRNIFAQITLTNTGIQLFSNNRITYVGMGLSQTMASLKARLDCSEPYSGEFASSLVIVAQHSLVNLLKSLTLPAMKDCCFTSASEDFRNHICITTGSQVTRWKETMDIPKSPFQEKTASNYLVA